MPERGLEPPTNCLRSRVSLNFLQINMLFYRFILIAVVSVKNNPKIILNLAFFGLSSISSESLL